MTVACDFCPNESNARADLIFAAAPRHRAHICEECVSLAALMIARRKAEDAECSGAT